jgi:hypothetical protein
VQIRKMERAVGVERKTDVSELSSSRNSSSVPRKNLAFQGTVNCPVNFEAFTALMIQVDVFRVVTPRRPRLESTALVVARNVKSL